MKSGYTLTEISSILGFSRRTLVLYAELGAVEPEIDKGSGRGSARYYSRANVFQFLLVRELSECGIALGNMGPVIDLFKNFDPENNEQTHVVIENPNRSTMRCHFDNNADSLCSSALVVQIKPLIEKFNHNMS